MSRQGEKKRVVYRHPLGRYEVVETTGVNQMGEPYRFREAFLTPQRDARGQLTDADKGQTAWHKKIVKVLPAEPQEKRMRKQFSEDEKKRVRTMYRQGFSIQEIAFDLNRNHSTIYTYLVKSGLHGNMEREEWTDQHDKIAKALWEQGYSLRQIAERMGKAKSTVGLHLRRIGKKTG